VGSQHDGQDDVALIAAVGDRSDQALQEIYRRHGGAVWAIAKRVCGRDDMAGDICRTVFTDLWSDPGRFDPARGALRSWLVARAHGHAVELARANHADPHPPDADGAPPSASPEVALHANGLSERARRAVEQLTAHERDAILLTYFGGRSPSYAARLLGTLEGTLKAHIRSGMANLRRALEVEGVTK
jgi:RNA polymerase sigma-70 factor, ECF subfamily